VPEYLIIIEPTKTGFSAYSPDLPGCITVGNTVEQTRENMQEAIDLYIEELIESGENIPRPGKLKDQINTIGDLQSGTFIAFIPNQIGFHAKSA
ncbi:MAG: type II toxin-antitoxin system HicB family antitoxin, partial [Chitinophagales bacterium]